MSNQESPITRFLLRVRASLSSVRVRSLPVATRLPPPVAVLLDNVRSMYNVGAFFRAADGVGLQKLMSGWDYCASAQEGDLEDGLGAEMTVAWEHDWDAVHMAEGLRAADLSSLPSRPACMRWICSNGSPGSRSALPLAMRSRGCVRSCWRWRMHMCAFPCWGRRIAECRHGGRDCDVRIAAEVAATPPL